MTEDQARKTYDRALKVEQEFGEYFTGLYYKCFIGFHKFRNDIFRSISTL